MKLLTYCPVPCPPPRPTRLPFILICMFSHNKQTDKGSGSNGNKQFRNLISRSNSRQLPDKTKVLYSYYWSVLCLSQTRSAVTIIFHPTPNATNLTQTHQLAVKLLTMSNLAFFVAKLYINLRINFPLKLSAFVPGHNFDPFFPGVERRRTRTLFPVPRYFLASYRSPLLGPVFLLIKGTIMASPT